MTEKSNQEIDPGDLNVDLFSPLLNESFHLDLDSEETITLELLEALPATDHRPAEAQKGRTPFVLLFGCETVPLPQGTYQLSHGALGKMTIFMTPIESYGNGHKLEAIFS